MTRARLLLGEITYDEAKALCADPINELNRVSREKAIKYGLRPRKISFSGLMR